MRKGKARYDPAARGRGERLVIQFIHRFNLIAIDLLGAASLGIFVGHKPGIIVHLRLAIGHNGFAVGRF